MRIRILAATCTTAALALAGAVTATSANAATQFTCAYHLTLTGNRDTATVTPTPYVNGLARITLKSNPADFVGKRVSILTDTAVIKLGRNGIPNVVTPDQITVTVKTTICNVA